MTPTFSRNWLMKTTMVLVLLIDPLNLRRGLRHQAGLQAHVYVAHFALEFGPGHKGGHAVDHDDVESAAAYEVVGDFERLLRRVGLRNEEFVHLNAQCLRIRRVEGVFDVDVGRRAILFLCLGDDVEREGRLAGRLCAKDFDDPSAGQSAYP